MLNCPSCGAQTHKDLRFTKLMVCEYCNTTLFIEDEAIKQAGEKSVIVDTPSIFKLGQRYRYKSMTFEALGRVQFSYGNGYWDEWWVMTDAGDGKWISVDEGDIAIESLVNTPVELPSCTSSKVGNRLVLLKQELTITETGKSTCTAVAGQLPEIISPGEVHRYLHCSGSRGTLYTVECCGNEKQLFKGSWVDPFDIESLAYG